MSHLFVQTKSDGVFKLANQHSELLGFTRSKTDKPSESPVDKHMYFFIVLK
jgi:hypothetical protein